MFTLKKNSEKIQCSKMQELFAEYPDERPKQDQSLSRFTNIISTHYADVYLKVKDKFDKLSKKQEEIFNDYPLLKNIGGWTDHRDIEEYVWYINGKYQSKFQQ
jgi:hypothetical protein